ncbi:helix-turn-helix transcriptional regulator [Parvibaculum sp.]|uniref:helix-turn-helix transcriptional regulator n=1 Tax=Parvibaculum sp. TaxID=2024848 RepID=UPI0039192213
MLNEFVTDQTVTFIEKVQQVKSTDDLLGVLQTTLSSFGVKYFTLYEFTGSTEKGALGNYPQDWGLRYAERRYEYRDPVARRLFDERKGFFWDEKSLRNDGRLNAKKSKVFFEGADFGLKEGYAHLISDGRGYVALTSFCSDKVERDPRMLPALHLVSIYMYGKYRELTAPQPVADVPYLTPRQRECLQWVAAGKSDWDVATIMNIGQATVHSHIEAAKRTLGVATRVQAVVKAYHFGLIADAPHI